MKTEKKYMILFVPKLSKQRMYSINPGHPAKVKHANSICDKSTEEDCIEDCTDGPFFHCDKNSCTHKIIGENQTET